MFAAAGWLTSYSNARRVQGLSYSPDRDNTVPQGGHFLKAQQRGMQEQYGALLYAVGQRRLARKELRQYPIPMDWW
jgi:hypothetical protein